MSVLLITSFGDIVIDLFVNDCPKATWNFIKLCKIKYYNNCLFYNVQKDFIAQTGEPSNTSNPLVSNSIYGITKGPSSKYFNDEIHPKHKHNKIGVVATSNQGPNMNTSGFYIQLTNNNWTNLNNKHTIFGQVEEGFDVWIKINNSYCDRTNRPYQNIRIKHTVILDDPFEDINGMVIPSQSPEMERDNQDNGHYWEDDFDLNNWFKDKETEAKLKEKLQEHEAKNKAIILELLEDIPDSEIKPPENILFVCKLNPITRDDDLEIIFSRFGPIKSCQVIRDKKTGESLQYAFIEFEKVEDCEMAYLKMNGVMIDDKRIKVDFSQSVSKYWVNYKKEAKQEKESDNITMLQDNVKLEIMPNKNFNIKRNDGYKMVFDEGGNTKKNSGGGYHDRRSHNDYGQRHDNKVNMRKDTTSRSKSRDRSRERRRERSRHRSRERRRERSRERRQRQRK